VLSSVFKTVTWVIDNVEKFTGLGQIVGTIAGRIGDVVNNRTVTVDVNGVPTPMPATQALARDVKTFLDGLIPVGLTFGAAQLSIGNLPRDVADKIAQVQALPRAKVEAAIGKVVDRAKALFKKADNEPDNVIATLPPMKVAGVDVKLWVANVNGKAVIMRSAGTAPAAELDLARDLPSKLDAQLKTNVKDALKKLVDDANAALAAMGTATKNVPKPGKAATGVSAALKTTTESFRKLAADLKLEADALVAAGATCFFGLACFAAGTPLRTPWGAMNIEDVRVGDTVLSRDEYDPTGAVVGKVVEEVFVRLAAIWELLIGGRVIGTSGEHPFYAWEKGWVPARELAAGDTLLCEDGVWRCVDGVRDTGEWRTVYNLRVADYHTYFVGAAEWGFGVWAHNTCEPVFLHTGADALAGIAKTPALLSLLQRAKVFREHNTDFVRNWAIAIGIKDGHVVFAEGLSAGSRNHSEKSVYNAIVEQKWDSITAYFSERTPCSKCRNPDDGPNTQNYYFKTLLYAIGKGTAFPLYCITNAVSDNDPNAGLNVSNFYENLGPL
jgi:hypothetical protein